MKNNKLLKLLIIFTSIIFCETKHEIYELRKKAEIYNHQKNKDEALKIYLILFKKDQNNYELLKKIKEILISKKDYELLIENYNTFIKNSSNPKNIFDAEVELLEVKIWNKDPQWINDLYNLGNKYESDKNRNNKYEFILHKIFNNREIEEGYDFLLYLRNKYEMPSFYSRQLISIFKKDKYYKESINESIIFLTNNSNKKISSITKNILIDQIFELLQNILDNNIIKSISLPISHHQISSNKFLNIKTNYEFNDDDLNYVNSIYQKLIENNLQPEVSQLKKAEMQFHIYNDLDSAYKILNRIDNNTSKINTKVMVSSMKSDILLSKGYLDSALYLINKQYSMVEGYLIDKKSNDLRHKNLEITLFRGNYNNLVNELDSLINDSDLNDENYNDLLELKMVSLFFKEDIELFEKYTSILYKLKLNKNFEAALDLIDLVNSENILISELAQFQYALIELQKGNTDNVQKIISEINSNTVYYEISLILNAEIEDYIKQNYDNAIKLYEIIIDKFPNTIFKEDIIKRLNELNKLKDLEL